MANKSKRGAKSKYDAETFPTLVHGYMREGSTEREAADKLGVSVATFETYKNKFPEFLAAVKEGKKPIDFMVENASLKRALGFEYEEVRVVTRKIVNENGEETEAEVVETTTTTKIALPDQRASEFWLKNRKPEKWREKQNIDHTTKGEKITQEIDYSQLSDEALREIAAQNETSD